MKCEIIKDLLPSYIDELTSEVSNEAVEQHLSECESCRSYYEQMKQQEPGILETA
ncbi:MAG: zf-HC2 domain-containing protein, partial [Oscillospiraceae bacterium]|nr:zf-HC2 domain-containing protein [Oscillospiraceae bacterium]